MLLILPLASFKILSCFPELQEIKKNDTLKDILRSAATEVQSGQGVLALEELITKTSTLKKNTSSIRDIDATDIDSAIAYFENVKEQNALGRRGIKTGLPGFDNYLPSGIMPGQLGVFLAYPGIGKSWMALYFAVQAWKQGKTPLIISLEMSETEVRNRVLAIMGEGLWSHRKLSNSEIELDMLKKWHENKLKGMFAHFDKRNALAYLADTPLILQDMDYVATKERYGNKKKGTPPTPVINAWGRRLQADWMLTHNELYDDLNYKHIRSLGYVREAISWNINGNFDRVSALQALMIYREERAKYVIDMKEDNVDVSDYFIRNYKPNKNRYSIALEYLKNNKT